MGRHLYLFRRKTDNSPVFVGYSQSNSKPTIDSVVLDKIYKAHGSIVFWTTYTREEIPGDHKLWELDAKLKDYIKEYNTIEKGYNLSLTREEVENPIIVPDVEKLLKTIVITPLGPFSGYAEAAKANGKSNQCIKNRCESTSEKWKDWRVKKNA